MSCIILCHNYFPLSNVSLPGESDMTDLLKISSYPRSRITWTIRKVSLSEKKLANAVRKPFC